MESVTAQDGATAGAAARDARKEHDQAKLARLAGALKLVGAALLLALVVRAFVVQPFAIPSGSMSPELEPGDFLFVDKSAYGWSLASLPLASGLINDPALLERRLFARPARPGDVIVFVSPEGQDYVKRLVAGGGDRVRLDGGLLVVNGLPVPCTPLGDGLCRETLANGASHVVRSDGSGPLATMAEMVVPAGHYFVLGDNRDRSADSRLTRAEGGVGLVPEGRVIGRASRLFFSVGETVRWDRIGQVVD
jgi:signal peptidase I